MSPEPRRIYRPDPDAPPYIFTFRLGPPRFSLRHPWIWALNRYGARLVLGMPPWLRRLLRTLRETTE